MSGEFERIARYFRPLAHDPAAGQLADDAALLTPPPGEQLALTHDAIVEDVHFLSGDPASAVARKVLRVNYSDLAAMGARPLGVLLSLNLTRRRGDSWVADFAMALGEDLERFGGALLGGDSTIQPDGRDVIGLTAIGAAPAGTALTRAGARPGMDIWVSGTLGDGALGLMAARGDLGGIDYAAAQTLAERYRAPTPRLALGQALRGVAAAAIDVSDGLMADLGHLCAASGCGAVVDAPALPLSPAAQEAVAAETMLFAAALTGGDDYELCFAAAPEQAGAVRAAGATADIAVTRIGAFVEREGVVAQDADGGEIAVDRPGWSHDGDS